MVYHEPIEPPFHTRNIIDSEIASGDFFKLISFCEQELQKNKKCADSATGLAIGYVMLNRISQAYKILNSVLKVIPRHLILLHNASVCLIKLGKYRECIRSCDQGLCQSDSSGLSQYFTRMRSMCLLILNNFELRDTFKIQEIKDFENIQLHSLKSITVSIEYDIKTETPQLLSIKEIPKILLKKFVPDKCIFNSPRIYGSNTFKSPNVCFGVFLNLKNSKLFLFAMINKKFYSFCELTVLFS